MAREIVFGSLLLVMLAFVCQKLVNLRHNKAVERHEKFRNTFQTTHEQIDSLFNHKDLIVDGLNYHYVDEGSLGRKVLLFLHGFPESWYSWKYVLPLINPNYRLIAVDMKGYGRSDKNLTGNYEWHNVADELNGFMTKGLGVDKYFVVGHDWVTLIGSVLVDDHQDNILGFIRMQVDLIYYDPFENITSFLKALKNRIQLVYFQLEFMAKFFIIDAEKLVKFIYKTRLTMPFKEDDRKYITYELSLPNAHVVYKYFWFEYFDLKSAVLNICKNRYTFPVMQLQADSDPSQPVHLMDNVATECPNVEMYWVYNASHFSNFDQPEAVADAINYFLEKHNNISNQKNDEGETKESDGTDVNNVAFENVTVAATNGTVVVTDDIVLLDSDVTSSDEIEQ